MEEVVALQVQMVQMVVLVQAEQLDRVEVLGEVDPHLMELVVVEVLHRRVDNPLTKTCFSSLSTQT